MGSWFTTVKSEVAEHGESYAHAKEAFRLYRGVRQPAPAPLLQEILKLRRRVEKLASLLRLALAALVHTSGSGYARNPDLQAYRIGRPD